MNNFPISVSQIAEGMNNAASMMANAGMTFDESVALLTSANTTVQNISKSSTALRTIIARLRNVKSELDDAGEVWNEAKYQELISALTKGGVDLQDATGALRNPYEVLKELAERWSSMSSDVRAAITTALAGTRQQDVFSSLMGQFQEATGAMEAMADSAGALESAYGIFEDSMQGHINKLKAAFEELSMEAVNKGLVNSVVDLGTSAIEALTPIVSLLGDILSFLGPIGTALTTIAGIGIFKYIDKIPKAISLFKSTGSMVPVFEKIGTTLGMSATAAGTFATALGPITIGLAAVAAAFVVADSLIETFGEAVKNAEKAAKSYNDQMAKVSEINTELDTTKARIDELNAKGGLTLVEQEELNNLKAQNELLERQLEIEQQIATARGREAAEAAKNVLTKEDVTGVTGYQRTSRDNGLGTVIGVDEAVARGGLTNVLDAVIQKQQLLNETRRRAAALEAELATATDRSSYEYKVGSEQLTRYNNMIGVLEGEITDHLGVINDQYKTLTSTPQLAKENANIIADIERVFEELSDKTKSAQDEIDGFLARPSLQKYVEQVQAAFADAGEAMSDGEFKKAFPELAKQAEESGIRVIDIINTIASALGLLDFNEVRKQLQRLKPQNIGISAQDWFDYLGGLDNTKIKALYEAMQNGIDWSTWDWPDFEAFFDDTEEAVESITTLSEAYEKFDEITSTIDKLTEAHEKLADGSLELADVIDLIEEFPDLAEYVDLTAENFGNLDDGLRAVANDAPTALVDELRSFAETADLTDAQRKMILDLSDALASMPESSLDSLSSKYGELADEVSAAKRAVDELNSSLSEDTNTGYTTRAKAMEEMIDLMEHGAIGSESKLWSIADSFGLLDIPGLIDFSNGVEAAADQLDELIRVRQRWYDGATDDGYSSEGIQNFLEDVSNMTSVLEEYGDVVWEVSDEGINIDIPNGQFEDFAHAIGMSTEELVDMLIQLGQFTDFDWRDVVPEDLQAEIDVTANTDSAKRDLEAIGSDGGTTTVDVEANKKPADMAMGIWRAEQKDEKATIPVSTDNSGVDQGVAAAEQTVENAVAEPMVLNVDASAAIEKVVNTQKLINSMHGKTVTVSLKVSGLSSIQNAINKISQVKSKTVTVTTNTYTNQVKADGTAHAGGNWGTPRTEKALTGELGPEIVVDPSTGRWYTVGDNGAEFVRLPKGSIVFNHKQTEALLKNGHVTGRGNALAEGTAYVSASGSFKKYSYSSSTSSSSSSSKTSGSSSYSSSNKSSSTTATTTSNTELENWFEKLYAYHQHLLAMEQESQEDYILWLEDAYKRAYKDGSITLEDFYKY